jgi:hypothetical protein
LENKVRLISAWVGTLDDKQKEALITSLVLFISKTDKKPFEEVIGELTKSLEGAE